MLWRELVLLIHSVAVITWFGGLFFYLVVAGPAARKAPGAAGARVVGAVDERFRHVLWGSVEVAVVTGIALFIITMSQKGTTMDIPAPYTRVLIAKLFLSVLVIGLQLYNHIRINPLKAALIRALPEGAAQEPDGFTELQSRTVQLYVLELVVAVAAVLLGQHMRVVL